MNELRQAYGKGFAAAKTKGHCPHIVGHPLRDAWMLGRVHGHDYLVTVEKQR